MNVTREPSDDKLFADLRRMWEKADPMPADLPVRVLFALDLDQLDMDFELLHLVSTARDDLTVRSAATDVTVRARPAPRTMADDATAAAPPTRRARPRPTGELPASNGVEGRCGGASFPRHVAVSHA